MIAEVQILADIANYSISEGEVGTVSPYSVFVEVENNVPSRGVLGIRLGVCLRQVAPDEQRLALVTKRWIYRTGRNGR